MDDYTHKILRIIIARNAVENGFSKISETALDIFVDAVVDYLSDISKLSSLIAISARRTEVNGYDLFAALRDKTNENVKTLTTYISGLDQSKLNYKFIPNYPEPFVPQFYKQQVESKEIKTHPPQRFPINQPQNQSKPYIPVFYPNIPEEYIQKEEENPAVQTKTQKSESDTSKLREQKIIQTEIGNLDRVKRQNGPSFVNITQHMLMLLGTDININPTQACNSLLITNGIYPLVDPEKEFQFELKKKEDN